MNILHKLPSRTIALSLLIALALIAFAACSPAASNSGAEHEEDAEHEEGDEHDEDEAHDEERIPNDGAIIRIILPEDGATFAEGDEIVVEVEVENFELGERGDWHVYVDGANWGMVVEGELDHVLRGLEVGDHEISVFLGADHIELEEGDSIHISVTE